LDRHSLKVLNQLREYDSFLDSLRSIADMGCGTGEDITWWATLESRDDPPRPYNYSCYAVDKDPFKLSHVPDLANIFKYKRDFTQHCIPQPVDLIWAHDSLQYSHNPLETLRAWNNHLNLNGMLVLCVPQHSGVNDNRYYSQTHSGCYYHYTPTNLIYMLAVNGFDCRDAYLLKQFNDPWIHIAVYKSDIAPMDPAATSLFDLLDTGLLHPTVVNSINKHGYLKQEDILYPWLDKENYYIDYIPQWTEIPPEAEVRTTGVVNTSVQSADVTFKQAPTKEAKTNLLTPIGVMKPPKGRYVK